MRFPRHVLVADGTYLPEMVVYIRPNDNSPHNGKEGKKCRIIVWKNYKMKMKSHCIGNAE